MTFKAQVRRIWPRGGNFHEKRRGKNRPSTELKAFFEEAKADGKTTGIYEISLQIGPRENPSKAFDFRFAGEGVEIKKIRNGQKIQIALPQDLKLRLPEGIEKSVFFDSTKRSLGVRIPIVETITNKRKLENPESSGAPAKKAKLAKKAEESESSSSGEEDPLSVYRESIGSQFSRVPLVQATNSRPAKLDEDSFLNEDSSEELDDGVTMGSSMRIEEMPKPDSTPKAKKAQPKVKKAKPAPKKKKKAEKKEKPSRGKKKAKKKKGKARDDKALSLVDDLVGMLDQKAKKKLRKEKAKHEAITELLDVKVEKKRGKAKVKKKFKNQGIQEVRKQLKAKKRERRAAQGKGKSTRQRKVKFK